MTQHLWAMALLGLLAGCSKQDAAAPSQNVVAGDAPATDSERTRAGQLVQRLYAASHGAVAIQAIVLESGVFRVTVAPTAQGAKPFDVHLTRDLHTLFPQAKDLGAQLQATALDRVFGDCLKAKGLRVYGDPNHAQTQRQLAEIGAYGLPLLVDCAGHPNDCKVLGQTTLPLVMYGTQRVTALVPRAVLGQWTGCGAGK